MSTLYFEKLSRFDRHAEPVSVSIPFARGRIMDPGQLVPLPAEQGSPVDRLRHHGRLEGRQMDSPLACSRDSR